jgi:hypothetical protein
MALASTASYDGRVSRERVTREGSEQTTMQRFAIPAINLILGTVMVLGSLGIFGARWVFIGTDSWQALMGVGILIAALGVWQIIRTARARE